MTIGRIWIRTPDDFHAHFRTGEMLKLVAPLTAQYFRRALLMPNTTPEGILTGDEARRYRDQVLAATKGFAFTPLLTIKITGETTPDIIRDAKAKGVIAGKLYPVGVTHNSTGGVKSLRELVPVFEAMQSQKMVLCLHGEMPGEPDEVAEYKFLPELTWLVYKFPRLRIVLEHVSTGPAVQTVLSLPSQVAATVTVHHLLLTSKQVWRDGVLQPHNFCKPVAKSEADRDMLRKVVFSGWPKFFLGTDSAPHPRSAKERDDPAPGSFTAPHALALLAELFAQHRALSRMDGFTSTFGARFYHLPLNHGRIELRRETSTIPDQYGDVVPFGAGLKLFWKAVPANYVR